MVKKYVAINFAVFSPFFANHTLLLRDLLRKDPEILRGLFLYFRVINQ